MASPALIRRIDLYKTQKPLHWYGLLVHLSTMATVTDKSYGWRGRLGNISPTACTEIFPYEFYRVAPDGVTLVLSNLAIRDARESSQVESSWLGFEDAIASLRATRVDHITLAGAPLVLAKGVERYRELLSWLRQQSPVPATAQPAGVRRRLEASRRD